MSLTLRDTVSRSVRKSTVETAYLDVPCFLYFALLEGIKVSIENESIWMYVS